MGFLPDSAAAVSAAALVRGVLSSTHKRIAPAEALRRAAR
jgi:hypothetical protein